MLYPYDWLLFSLFKHLTTINLHQLSVLFLDMFFQPFFSCKWLLHVLHKALPFHGGSMSSMSQYSFQCFVESGYPSTINSFFPFLAFSLSYFHIFIFCYCLSPYFLDFHIFLDCLFFVSNNNLFIVFFNLIFWAAVPRDGFTCFIYAIVYFLSIAEHFATKISLDLSVL